MAAIMLWVHTMKGIAARDTQQRGALIACNGLPSGSIPSIRKNQPELSHHDAVYRNLTLATAQNAFSRGALAVPESVFVAADPGAAGEIFCACSTNASSPAVRPMELPLDPIANIAGVGRSRVLH